MTKEPTLLKLLLASVPEPEFEVSRLLDISPATLSRHSAAITKKASVLEKIATFFTERAGVVVAPNELQQPIGPAALIGIAKILRKRASNVR